MPSPAKIDRLMLEMPGGSADSGHQMALLIAAALSEAGALPQAGDLPHLRITIQATPGTSPHTLARRIAAETRRAMDRTP